MGHFLELTNTIRAAEFTGLIKQGKNIPYIFELTDKGHSVMRQFTKNVCDSKKIQRTRDLVTQLSDEKRRVCNSNRFCRWKHAGVGKNRFA